MFYSYLFPNVEFVSVIIEQSEYLVDFSVDVHVVFLSSKHSIPTTKY